MDNVHGRKTIISKPTLKKHKKDGKKEQRKCLNEIITALNSHHNGSKSDREKKLIEIVKDLAQMQKGEIECKLYCKLCRKPLENESRLKLHEDGEHLATCEECGNKETDEDNLSYHKQGEVRFIDFTIGFDNDIAEQQYRNNVPIGHVEYFSM